MILLQSKKMGRRYHSSDQIFPVTSWSLPTYSSAYIELRDSGALILSSERILRDYKNYFKPKPGINKENIESLREKTQSFSDVHRYVALSWLLKFKENGLLLKVRYIVQLFITENADASE